MIFKILSYISGFFTGFIFGTIAGTWLFNYAIEWIRTRGGMV